MMNMPKKKKPVFQLAPTCVAVLLALGIQTIQANPLGGTVVNGSANYNVSGTTLTVTNTPGTIINWQSFNIQQNEITRFAQQSASSAVLNRVITNNPSQILGTLQSNGRVFLINPNGILFGQGVTVDVAGLVATTLNLSNADFLAGSHHYTQVPGAANLSNAGQLNAQQGGEIYLIAPNVENTGIINAPNGDILLAAGHEVQLTNSLDPNLRANIIAPAGDATNVGQLVASAGRLGLFGAIVKNGGTVNADSATLQGGKIVFRASQNVTLDAGSKVSASAGTVTTSANEAVLSIGDISANAGGSVLIRADRIMQTGILSATQGGNIELLAQNGIVQTSCATLDVSNANGAGGSIVVDSGRGRLFTSANLASTGASGGTIHLLGNDIYLANSRLDASGLQSGGEVLIGGDAHGANPIISNAKSTFVNSTTSIKADALTSGNGGRVIIWADVDTQYFGTLTAKGGSLAGNGGFAEVSGKNTLSFGGFADLSATSGLNGQLLLDPRNVTIGIPTSYSSFQLYDPHPFEGNMFGRNVTVLSNDNIVVAVPEDDLVALNSGAVYLFDGATGALISALTGSSPGDYVGGAVTELNNGNFVVLSSAWDNGAVVDAGAVTWGSGVAGVSGAVSSANSLVGSTANDMLGVGSPGQAVFEVGNGNYLVNSPFWNDGANGHVGAVTWGNGMTGVRGVVSASNSLVGSSLGGIGDQGIKVLSNGNYLVRSPWFNGDGAATWVGAVTWGDGAYGTTGIVSSSNSILGSTSLDMLGFHTITELANGNYVISCPDCDVGASVDAGAVIWGSGAAGVAGVVSYVNSLVGSSSNDVIGSGRVIALPNGNYVVGSPLWDNGTVVNAGAVTWGNGATGVTGAVSAANSLVGSTAYDRISFDTYFKGITVLSNSNYLVRSFDWDNGSNINAGAVTWGSGTNGVTGTISASNSLVGSKSNDNVGSGQFEIVTLSNGNYVVSSPNWDNGSVVDAGAVTWGDGTSGVVGEISASNSLVGSSAADNVGSYNRLYKLSNGNYVVISPLWDNGSVVDAGAVTWGNGMTGVVGVVSASNSLVGSSAYDQIGEPGAYMSYNRITELANGNFVVISPYWDNGSAIDAGAVTWGNGSTGVTGEITAANSLVGDKAADMVGVSGVTALHNGNYVVSSFKWDNGSAVDAGAVTWGNGTFGVAGVVSASNSLVGSSSLDFMSTVYVLSNGNYVVRSPYWDSGSIVDAGAATWGSGLTGVTGAISASNSLVGSQAGDQIGLNFVYELSNGNYIVNSANWDNGAAINAGAVTWGDGQVGVVGEVSALNSLVGSSAGDTIGSGIGILRNGDYIVASSWWDNGALVDAGAITMANGMGGTVGAISPISSFVGKNADDMQAAYMLARTSNKVISSNARISNFTGRIDVVDFSSPQSSAGAAWQYSDYLGRDITISPTSITAITNTGTSVQIQASSDVNVNAPINTLNGTLGDSNIGGSLTLQAGRSIFVNANITTDDADLNLIANDKLSNGVIDADRLAGVAQIVIGSGVTIDAGGGNVSIRLLDGLGGSGTQSSIGDFTLNNGSTIKAYSADIGSSGLINVNGSINLSSGSGLITNPGTTGGGTIGGGTIGSCYANHTSAVDCAGVDNTVNEQVTNRGNIGHFVGQLNAVAVSTFMPMPEWNNLELWQRENSGALVNSVPANATFNLAQTLRFEFSHANMSRLDDLEVSVEPTTGKISFSSRMPQPPTGDDDN